MQAAWFAAMAVWAAFSLSRLAEHSKRIANALDALRAMAERGRR